SKADSSRRRSKGSDDLLGRWTAKGRCAAPWQSLLHTHGADQQSYSMILRYKRAARSNKRSARERRRARILLAAASGQNDASIALGHECASQHGGRRALTFRRCWAQERASSQAKEAQGPALRRPRRVYTGSWLRLRRGDCLRA